MSPSSVRALGGHAARRACSSLSPSAFLADGGRVLFTAAGALWTTDGTPAGTSVLAQVAPATTRTESQLIRSGNFVYFVVSPGPDDVWSYDLTTRDALRSRQLIDHQRFREVFGSLIELDREKNRQDYYQNTAKGERISVSICSHAAGFDAAFVIADDIHDFSKASARK